MRKVLAGVGVLCSVCASMAQTPARPAPAPAAAATHTAVLGGAVLTTDTPGRPLRRVVVAILGADRSSVAAITDDSGRFTFRGLPAGRYTLTVSKPGYVTTVYGATKPGRAGTAIALADGQQITNVSIRMLHGAAISGTLTTESGEPAREARVSALQYFTSPTTGERTLGGAGSFFGQPTDDRGAFRLYGLAPGEYLIVANPPRTVSTQQTTDAEYQRAMQVIRGAADVTTLVTSPASAAATGGVAMFYPGTSSVADAQLVTVGPGEERTGISFVVRPVRVGRIDGSLTGVDGQPVSGVAIQMVDPSRIPGPSGAPPVRVVSDAAGRFTIPPVPPGTYTLIARAGAAGAARGAPSSVPPLWALTEVTTDGLDTSVTMSLRAGITVSGKISLDSSGASPAPDLSRARVSLQAVISPNGAALTVPSGAADANGAFAFTGVAPGRYRLLVTVPGATATNPGWVMKSATVNGADAIDTPLEVTAEDVPNVSVVLTDRVTELSGLMLDKAGQAAPEYFLVAFPQNASLLRPQSQRVQQARPGADGKFIFRGLPPGEYFLAAVTDVQPGDLSDRTFLQQLTAAALKVTLGEGDKRVQNVQLK